MLEYALGGDDTVAQSWRTLATGTGAVNAASLGQLDTTLLLNGIYALRLTATNANGQSASTQIAVIVSGQMKVGNFTLAFSDLMTPVAGLPIEIIRSYDSRDPRVGDFGAGWQLGIKNVRLEKSAPIGRFWQQSMTGGIIPKYCLAESKAHLVTITFAEGRVYKFATTLTPQCQNVAPLTGTTVSYVLSDNYDANGNIVSSSGKDKFHLQLFTEQTNMKNELEKIQADLNSLDSETRELALDRIGEMKPDNAFSLFLRFLSDPDDEVRSTAAFHLGEISDIAAIPYLLDSIRLDSSEKVRVQAILALENYHSPEVLMCLTEEARRANQSRMATYSIAQQLSKYDEESSVQALAILLNNWDINTRRMAAESLYQLNRPILKAVWTQALKDRYDIVDIARKALEDIKKIKSE